MNRREFLVALAVSGTKVAPTVKHGKQPSSLTSFTAPGTVDSVRGPISVDALGVTLVHEHVLVDFIGADRVSPARYDRDQAFAKALPHLERIYELGCRTLVECTPAYIGRDPVLLGRLAEASKLHILTNTGYYGAADDKFLPPHAFSESADQLAARWVREAREGIDGTGIKPAFMKIGVDAGPLSDVDGRLVRAAAQTHRATGLPIYSHTGNGVAALAQVAVLENERTPLGSFVWVHAQNESDVAMHAQVARRGAWVSFDGVSAQSLDRHLGYVLAMREARLLDRVLVSHDAGWYHVGEPDGGTYRPHDLIVTDFLPALRARGVTAAEIVQLMVENPRRALTPTM
jgi:predicted metal-dependent phosphotriesterase family hydrolase